MAVDNQALAVQDEPRDIAEPDREAAAGALAHILGTGDLAQLTNAQRVGHYLDLCHSLSLNPRSRPFDWIEFYDPETKAKKLQLYPKASCADQLRRQHHISARITRREIVGELFVCEAEAATPSGRLIQSTKYVPLTDRDGNRLKGQRLANAMMKAETGVYRRATFALIGMAAPPDMDELERPRIVVVDGTGRVIDNPTPEQKALAENPDLARVVKEPTYEDMSADSGPLAGTPDQRVRPDELERPQPENRPRPSFKVSDEEIAKLRGAFFGIVKGTSLDNDEARADTVFHYTAAIWPVAKQTDSLSAFFARASSDEARAFLEHVRGVVTEESAPPPEKPATTDLSLPADPDWLRSDERPLMMKAWSDWAKAVKRLDPTYDVRDVTKLSTRELVHELRGMVGYAKGIVEEPLAERPTEGNGGPGEQTDSVAF